MFPSKFNNKNAEVSMWVPHSDHAVSCQRLSCNRTALKRCAITKIRWIKTFIVVVVVVVVVVVDDDEWWW